jgi:hypothetical protein
LLTLGLIASLTYSPEYPYYSDYDGHYYATARDADKAQRAAEDAQKSADDAEASADRAERATR